MKEMICIVCPRGCHLSIDETPLEAKGNTCPRGKTYGVQEFTAPHHLEVVVISVFPMPILLTI